MNQNDKVSVIIPCYNNESTIIETLESVCLQDYNTIEIIIINDGSKDLSKEKVENYILSKKSLDITLYSQINLGPSQSRNIGASKSSGKYLLFLDADDKIEATYISQCVAVFNKNSTINIVYSDANYFGAQEGKWKLNDFKLPQFLLANCIPICAMIKKDVFNKVGTFDENLTFTEDWELWIRIVKDFGGVYKIPSSLFFYRKRDDNTSLSDNKDVNDNNDKSKLYIYNKHYDYYKKFNLDITSLFLANQELEKVKKKYYSIWYKKIFYSLKKKK